MEQSFEENLQQANKRNLSIIKNDMSKRHLSTTKLVSFANKLDEIENETISETQRHLRNIQIDYLKNEDNESGPSANRSRMNSKYSINSSMGELFEAFRGDKNSANRHPAVADKRFFCLINTVKPSYKLGKTMKDVNKIIETNDALKSTNFDKETRKKMQTFKQSGSKLAISARKLLATNDYPD